MSASHRVRHARRRLDGFVSYGAKRTPYPEVYWRLVHALRARSDLLSASLHSGPGDDALDVVNACCNLSRHGDAWVRPPETWEPGESGSFLRYRSFVSHLLDRYPVPVFMTPTWASGPPVWHDLYLHLAAGHSVRRFRLPVTNQYLLTKRGAALFMQAPDDLHPLNALRWAHVRSLGADARLARLLVARVMPLMGPTDDERFWESVVRFVVTHQPICDEEVLAIFRFVHEQRFLPGHRVWGPAAGAEPIQPDFSLAGRTLMSLRRHMANWRTEFADRFPETKPETNRWTPSGIRPFEQTEEDGVWTIEELLTDRELRIEGSIMQHCVATYISDCARRRTTIWSMKVQRGRQRKRVLTIEVVPGTRTVWQAKGRQNSAPSEMARNLLQTWAARERLELRSSPTNGL